MEQHPVPQQISAYEFKLVGDMTLKQFGFLAGGVVAGLIIYSLPLPAIFKWPLVILAAFGGFALAFLPIEERPLTTWIVAFFKSVFSPTMYVWKKQNQQTIISPGATQPENTTAPPAPAAVPVAPPSPLPTPVVASVQTKPVAPVEQINQLFQTTPVPVVAPRPMATTPYPVPPKAKTKPVRKPKPVVLPEKPNHNGRPRVMAKTTTELPIPTPPTQANILVGMVLDKNGQMVEGAILEIRNSQNMPVRALRTNKLGQFRIATPLSDDLYEIETEKEGLLFDTIKIEAKGEIINPIEIRAK